MFARLDRLDTRLDERDDLLLQHIDSRFDQLAPRLKHVEAVQHELATSVQAVRDDHARQIASLSKHLDALSEAGPGWGALEAALDLSTDPAHQDEYEREKVNSYNSDTLMICVSSTENQIISNIAETVANTSRKIKLKFIENLCRVYRRAPSSSLAKRRSQATRSSTSRADVYNYSLSTS
uniref:Uncharacterized protein n=1 Tax=Trichogramma kaykai TaxID=54128 RepID=A0ABD2W753_9HYME